jgi:hypothetical protein
MIKKEPQYKIISIESGGKVYTGSYYIERKTITVHYQGFAQTTQIGGSTPESLARLILSELVSKSNR